MIATLIALGLGALAALVGGISSGIVIGGEALGKEMAGAMGGLYGLLSGGVAVILGLLILTFIVGAA